MRFGRRCTLTLMSDDTHYGYIRVVVNATTLRMEFHPKKDGGTSKTPDDAFTLDLKAREQLLRQIQELRSRVTADVSFDVADDQ